MTPQLSSFSVATYAARRFSAPFLALALLVALSAPMLFQRPAQGQESPGIDSRFIGPGVRLLRWNREPGPHSLYAVEANLAEPFVRLGVSLGKGDVLGLEPISRQAERLTRADRYPIAGVNGDFFYYPSTQNPGIPTNAAVLDGELIRTPFNRSSLVLPASGPPSIRILQARATVTAASGTVRTLDQVNHPRGANQLVLYTPRFGASTRTAAAGVEAYLEPESFPLKYGVTQRAKVRAVQRNGGDAALNPGTWVLSGTGTGADFLSGLAPDDSVEIRVDFDPELGPNDQVLGGGPRLVRGGQISVEAEGGSINGTFSTARHPRTAIGFNGGKIYLVVVDGRQPGYSIGMSLAELAQVMVDLGCTDALNVDGGGSTAMWVRGGLVNRPSDGRERPVANGLLVFSTAPKGDPVRLAPSPEEIALLAGAETPVGAVGEDRYYNPIVVPAEKLAWTADPALGAVREGRFVAAAAEGVIPDPGQEYRSGTLGVEANGVRGTIRVRVYPRPARVEVLPATVTAGTATQTPFRVRAYDAIGRLLALPPGIGWQVTPELGAVDAAGVLRAGTAAARGVVTALVNGVPGSAQVEVTTDAPRALDDFETSEDWKQRQTPGVIGTAQVAEGTSHSGSRSLALRYDFGGGSGTRALYATTTRTLGTIVSVKLWAYGDGQGAWLRGRVRDGAGGTHVIDFARNVDWTGSWRELRAPLSDDWPAPITLESIYLAEPDADRKPKGVVYIDDLDVER
jgi:hypothetical protein